MNEGLNFGTIIAQIINFLLLLFIFKHFLGKKIVDAIEDRKSKLENIDLMQKQYKEKLELADIEVQKILEESRKKVGEIEEFAIASAKKEKESILSKAMSDAKALISSAEKEMEVEKNKMLSNIKTRVIDLALKVNKKLFDKENINKDFVEKELNSIN
ncbi:MAG: ATP synthase F0 subunit B [Candidatus Gracilibacteria bacterium]|nr:ATP synthase F0 subunit B [Candidatus Gracilibacteria bacterium]